MDLRYATPDVESDRNEIALRQVAYVPYKSTAFSSGIIEIVKGKKSSSPGILEAVIHENSGQK